jgi:hypothetical protein
MAYTDRVCDFQIAVQPGSSSSPFLDRLVLVLLHVATSWHSSQSAGLVSHEALAQRQQLRRRLPEVYVARALTERHWWYVAVCSNNAPTLISVHRCSSFRQPCSRININEQFGGEVIATGWRSVYSSIYYYEYILDYLLNCIPALIIVCYECLHESQV